MKILRIKAVTEARTIASELNVYHLPCSAQKRKQHTESSCKAINNNGLQLSGPPCNLRFVHALVLYEFLQASVLERIGGNRNVVNCRRMSLIGLGNYCHKEAWWTKGCVCTDDVNIDVSNCDVGESI